MKYFFLIILSLLFVSPAAAVREEPAGITRYKHTTTPAAPPPAGNTRVYCKDDGKCYKQTSDGTEAEIGAGGSGSGEGAKNYVINPGAEEDASTEVTYTNVTGSRNTTTPLYGEADFSFTIDSAFLLPQPAKNTTIATATAAIHEIRRCMRSTPQHINQSMLHVYGGT